MYVAIIGQQNVLNNERIASLSLNYLPYVSFVWRYIFTFVYLFPPWFLCQMVTENTMRTRGVQIRQFDIIKACIYIKCSFELVFDKNLHGSGQ